MSVTNGQLANQATFNNAFMSRTTNTSTTGEVSLANAGTGATVANSQKGHLQTFDAVGMTGLDDANRKIYANHIVIASGDDRKVAIGKLDAEFHASTGHTHSGGAGEGGPVSAGSLTNVNNFHAVYQSITKTSASGTSSNISTEMTGKTAGGGTSTAGVITSAPNNRAFIVNNNTNTFIEDAEGQRVYARVTESAGTWTLTYYTNEAGTETSHSLTSQDIRVIFWEVFNQASRPTIPSNPMEFGTLDVTADVVDASATTRGVVNTTGQTFAGNKIFNGTINSANTTASTNKDTGAITTEGGLGVELNINAGGTILGSNLSGTNTGDVSLAAFGSTPNANGASLTGQVLTNQPASASFPGGVSTTLQSFAGRKNFAAAIQMQAEFYGDAEDSAITGGTANIALPANLVVRLTNAGLTNISTASAPSADFQAFILTNATTVSITVTNSDTGSTSILTGTAANITMPNNSSIWLLYDFTASRWKIVGGSPGVVSGMTNPMTTGGDIIYGGASGTPMRLANGTAGQYLRSQGSTNAPEWEDHTEPTLLENLSVTGMNSSGDLLITLAGKDGSALSTTNPGKISIRSAAQATTTVTVYSITSNVTLTVPSGGTLGLGSSFPHNIYFYAFLDAGNAIVLGVAATLFSDKDVKSTTAVGTGSDSNNIIYTTSAQTNRPFKTIGRSNVTMGTPGNYATMTTNHANTDLFNDAPICVEAKGYSTALSTSITNITWTTTVRDTHNAFNGTTFTVPKTGWYFAEAFLRVTTSATWTLGQYVLIELQMGGVNSDTILEPSTGITFICPRISNLRYLTAGQGITAAVLVQSTTNTPTASGGDTYNHFNVMYLGSEI